mgnify:CR=1 FL=1
MDMKKFSNFAKKIDTVAAFFKGLSIVGIAGLLLLMVMLLKKENDFYENMDWEITLSFAKFQSVAGYVPDAQTMKMFFVGILVLGLVILAVRYYQLVIIRKIIEPMKEERPFDALVAKNIRKLSWVILIGDGIFSLISFGLQIWQYHAFDFENLFLSDKIISCKLSYTFDASCIVIFGILYLMSYIFRYGEELQKQSDETL